MTAALGGKPTFRIAVGRWLHISGWPAILLTPVVIPIILLLLLCERLFGLKFTADLTPKDVESYLQDFLDGRSGDWDWDDFTSVPISDPSLDAIRSEALLIELPVDETGSAQLRELLAKVRSLPTA